VIGAAACTRRGSLLGTLIGASLWGCCRTASDLLASPVPAAGHHRSGHYLAVTVDELRKRRTIK